MSELRVGDNFTASYTVNEAVYGNFISAYQDRNILHIDDEYAVSKGFKGKVMHGAILAGFLSHFVGELLPFDNVIVQSYNLQFAKPVYMDDQLELRVKTHDFFESVNTYELKYKFFNQQNVEVARGTINVGVL